MLNLTYTISNQKESISIDKHPNQEWLYLDKQTLRVGDQFEIDDPSHNIEHHLRLYQKKENIHIFSGVSDLYENYAALMYPYYLVWVNNSNTYCFIQDNQKVPNIKDDINGICLPEETIRSLFKGLFFTCPVYYLESNSRCKGIKKISELPKPFKAKVVEEHNDSEIPHKYLTFLPI